MPVQTDLNSFMQEMKEDDQQSIKVPIELKKRQIQLVKQAPSFAIDEDDEDKQEPKIEIRGEGEEFTDEEDDSTQNNNDMLLEEKTEADLKEKVEV